MRHKNDNKRISFIVCLTIVILILIAMFRTHTAGLHLPCEQRLHFRGMSWRAKSSLCRQPFTFLSCMRKIRHAIRKQLVRQICVSFTGIKSGKTACEQLSSSFCFVFLLFPPLVLSILAARFPRIVFLRKVLCYQL